MTNEANDRPDDESPLSPQEMLALSQAQSQQVGDVFNRPTMVIVFGWAIAWFVGFLLLWLAAVPLAGVRPFAIVAVIVFAVLMVAGIFNSAITGSRMGRGIRGNQEFQGRMYAIAWAVGCTAIPVLGGALFANGMSRSLAGIFYPAAYCIVIGLLYIVGAALWRESAMAIVGVFVIVIGIVAPFFGVPNNYLVMSVAGGGAFFVYGFILLTGSRRSRRAIASGGLR